MGRPQIAKNAIIERKIVRKQIDLEADRERVVHLLLKVAGRKKPSKRTADTLVFKRKSIQTA